MQCLVTTIALVLVACRFFMVLAVESQSHEGRGKSGFGQNFITFGQRLF